MRWCGSCGNDTAHKGFYFGVPQLEKTAQRSRNIAPCTDQEHRLAPKWQCHAAGPWLLFDG
jgi:hypothetical protein